MTLATFTAGREKIDVNAPSKSQVCGVSYGDERLLLQHGDYAHIQRFIGHIKLESVAPGISDIKIKIIHNN